MSKQKSGKGTWAGGGGGGGGGGGAECINRARLPLQCLASNPCCPSLQPTKKGFPVLHAKEGKALPCPALAQITAYEGISATSQRHIGEPEYASKCSVSINYYWLQMIAGQLSKRKMFRSSVNKSVRKARSRGPWSTVNISQTDTLGVLYKRTDSGSVDDFKMKMQL